MSQAFTESLVEQAALAWLDGLGCAEHLCSAIPDALLPELPLGELWIVGAAHMVGSCSS